MKENLHNEREPVQTCNFVSRNHGKHGEKLEERACMRTFETKIQELKTSVLTEVSRLTWEDRTQTGILDIPEKIIPGPGASLRCCIYKERAIDLDDLIGISHGDCPGEALRLETKLREAGHRGPILLVPHEPVTGAHVGPGMLSLYFHAVGK